MFDQQLVVTGCYGTETRTVGLTFSLGCASFTKDAQTVHQINRPEAYKDLSILKFIESFKGIIKKTFALYKKAEEKRIQIDKIKVLPTFKKVDSQPKMEPERDNLYLSFKISHKEGGKVLLRYSGDFEKSGFRIDMRKEFDLFFKELGFDPANIDITCVDLSYNHQDDSFLIASQCGLNNLFGIRKKIVVRLGADRSLLRKVDRAISMYSTALGLLTDPFGSFYFKRCDIPEVRVLYSHMSYSRGLIDMARLSVLQSDVLHSCLDGIESSFLHSLESREKLEQKIKEHLQREGEEERKKEEAIYKRAAILYAPELIDKDVAFREDEVESEEVAGEVPMDDTEK